MEIRDFFISSKGIVYPKIREIAFNSSNLFGNLGTLVNETNREVLDYFRVSKMDYDDSGVFIYQSNYDKNIALRIYKCFMDYRFNGDHDDELIFKLKSLQDKVKYTDFPTGVVTKNGFIIGQEIVYYPEYLTLYEIKKDLTTTELIEVYKKCLIILSELKNVGINYIDVHARNFLVNEDLDVKLIDFEYDLVKFNDEIACKKTILYFYYMVNLINKRIGINYEYEMPSSLDNAFKKLELMKKKV